MPGRAIGPNGAGTNGSAAAPIAGAATGRAIKGPGPAGAGGAAPPGATAAAGAAPATATGPAPDAHEQGRRWRDAGKPGTPRNVISHSKAAGVELLVSLEGDWPVLTVTDDGIGFDMDALAAAPAGGQVGLRLPLDLVHAAGGTLDVVSSPGAGTRVRLEVPQR